MTTNNSIHQQESHEPLSTIEHNTYADALLNAALSYAASGLSVFPVLLDTKSPSISSWKEFQTIPPEENTIRSWRFGDKNGLAIVCGSVSGNVELLDFDQKYALSPQSIFEAWKGLVDQQCAGLVDKLVHETSQSGGDHIFYRSSTVAGNLKLARRPTTEAELKERPNELFKTLIETRGQGGYVVSCPSRGYTLLSGSLTAIPEISAEERQILIDCARALNEYFPVDFLAKRNSRSNRTDRPGDIYNERGSIGDILTAEGWTHAGEKGSSEYWRRPGKRIGVSASFHRELKTFYVWSTNAAPFESERAYKPFSVYALLKHQGDFGKAAQDLAAQGYGKLAVRSLGKPTLADVENYLEERYVFRRNVITQKIEMCRQPSLEFIEMADYQLNSIYRELQNADLPLNIDALDRVLRSDFTENYNPIELYFDRLAPWDGVTDYIEQLAETVTLSEAKDKPLFKEYLTKWLVAQVACALVPKTVNQTAIVLVGAQGKGKTTWLSRLVPPSLENYRFIGTIDPNNKDTLVNLAQKILINLDELETFNKGDLGRLKSVMTQPDISVRLPYGRTWETMPRRASFVASVNQSDFLNDPTGSRRFLVFKTDDVEPFHSVDMNGVYAQAYALFKSGHVFYFSSDEIQKINERNSAHYKQSYEHELLLSLFEPGDLSANNGKWETATSVAERIALYRSSFKINSAAVRNLGYALTQEGYPQKAPKGQKQYYVKN